MVLSSPETPVFGMTAQARLRGPLRVPFAVSVGAYAAR